MAIIGSGGFRLPTEIRYATFLASSASALVLLISLIAMIQICEEINQFYAELEVEIGQFRVRNKMRNKLGIYHHQMCRYLRMKCVPNWAH
jgi:hypothetical protein